MDKLSVFRMLGLTTNVCESTPEQRQPLDFITKSFPPNYVSFENNNRQQFNSSFDYSVTENNLSFLYQFFILISSHSINP